MTEPKRSGPAASGPAASGPATSGQPSGGTARERAEAAVLAWVEEAGVEHDAGARPGELVVVLPGEAKLRTAVSVILGDQALSASAFVVRRPDENHAEFYRWLLRRNLRLPGIGFALDRAGDVFLVGRLPIGSVTPDAVDALMGAILVACDGAFNELLAIGFISSMRREWAWRVDRGESTRNLEAFRHLLEGGPGEAEPGVLPEPAP